MNMPARFVAAFFAWSTVLAALVAGFDWWVDPYLLFDAPRRPGFNAIKPAVETHELMMKAYQAGRVAPHALILGSSRVDIGIDPASAAWPEALRPAYNLGLVGNDIGQGLRYLRHVLSTMPKGAPPPTLVVGLDFENFLFRPDAKMEAPSADQPPGEIEKRLAVRDDGQPNPDRRRRVLQDYALGTLSLDALLDSFKSIAASRSNGWPNIEADGRLSDAQLRGWVASDGVDALFNQKNVQAVRQYLKPHQLLSFRPDEPPPEMAVVSQVLDFAAAHGMRVVLAVQPEHASRLELMDRMGYWPEFERWKRELVREVDAERARGIDVKLYDFGGYDAWATEGIPAPGDRTHRLKWFWDPVHYTTALGDMMVSEMLGAPGASAGPMAGTLLDSRTIDARLATVRRDRETYRSRQPADVARVERTFCQAKGC